MNKKELIEMFKEIRRDDKQTIDKLIGLNERFIFELRDLISEFRKYIKDNEGQKKVKDE